MICPRCHQEVDRNATECPYCGLRRRISPRKRKARRRRRILRRVIGFLILLIPILLLAYYFGVYRPAHPSSPKPASSESSIQPPASKETSEPVNPLENNEKPGENANRENELPMEDALSLGNEVELTGTFHINQWKDPETGWTDFYVLNLEKRIHVQGNGKNYPNISEIQIVFTDFNPAEYNDHRVRIKGLLDAARETSHSRRPVCIYDPDVKVLD